MTEEAVDFELGDLDYAGTVKLVKIARCLEAAGFSNLMISVDNSGENFNISLDHRFEQEFLEAPFRAGMKFGEYIEKFFDGYLTGEFDDLEVEEDGYANFTLEHLKEEGRWRLVVETTMLENTAEGVECTKELDEFSGNNREVLGVIVDKLQEHNIDSITYTFVGGGDSGGLDELQACDEFEAIKDDLVITPAGNKDTLIKMVKLFAHDYSTAAGNWWDNDGGRGSITIHSNGTVEREVEFFSYEQVDDLETTEFKTAFEIKYREPKASLNHEAMPEIR